MGKCNWRSINRSVSGCMMIVVPGLFGLAMYSPNLDKNGNPVRALKVCELIRKRYKVHTLDVLPAADKLKDLRHYGNTINHYLTSQMIEAASIGDIAALRKFVGIGGLDALNAGDYDGRTVLHLACAEGHVQMLEFLLSVKGLNLSESEVPLHGRARRAKERQLILLLFSLSFYPSLLSTPPSLQAPRTAGEWTR